MSERNYYVLCDDNCKFEGMTKEQIFEAIAEATGNTPVNIDDAFITKIKEQNSNIALKFWIGTQAEYNALESHIEDCFYITTDETDFERLEREVEQLTEDVETLQEKVCEIGWQYLIYGTESIGMYKLKNGVAYIVINENVFIGDNSNLYIQMPVTAADMLFSQLVMIRNTTDLSNPEIITGEVLDNGVLYIENLTPNQEGNVRLACTFSFPYTEINPNYETGEV